MRIPKSINLIFFCCLILWSCKDERSAPGIEERNEVVEITELTSAGRIEDFLEESGDSLYNQETVSAFYEENDYEPIWTSRELREELFRSIENIEAEGLFFEDYHGETLQELFQSLNSNSDEQNTSLEILLTDASLKLIDHLATGKLNPKEIYEIWGTPINDVEPKALLKKAISEGNILMAFDSVRQDHLVYHRLKKALNQFKKSGISEDSTTHISSGKLIRPGETNARITSVKKRLTELGYYQGSLDSLQQQYNEEVQEAVKAFQRDHGIQIDGLLGNSTISSLNLTRRDRYHQILVNMERWRWYPRKLGEHYIIINIPDYKLSVVKNGDTIRSHKTMVGTEARKTPVFSDEVAYIVYNPTWTIPPTIKKNDVIPGASRNLNYLKNRDIKIYDRNGKTIDPSEVNWSSAEARNYTYRQRAGSTNPLGLVKIIYPNEYMIYLHDTPSKNLFEKNARAQSSGCVRVQDALDLAEYLLSDQEEFDNEKIQEIISSGKTTEIPVKQAVKVHHFYWTASYEKDTIRFIDDIYNLDKQLWKLLRPEIN